MTLRRRVMVAMVAMAALFTLIQGGIAVLSMYAQEDDLVDELVLAETERLAARIREDGPEVLADDRILLPESYEAWWQGPQRVVPDKPIPPALRGLADGPHLDSAPEGEYHIMVMPVADGKLLVRHDASRNEEKVQAFAIQVLLLALFFILMAVGVARYVARLLIAPMEQVAALLDHWAPAPNKADSAEPVDEERRLLEAFQRVQERWEHGLARESERMADLHHEIRTPLAALRTDLEMLQLALAASAAGSAAQPDAGMGAAARVQRGLAAIDAVSGTLESLKALRMGRSVPTEPVQLASCVGDAWASLGDLPAKHALLLVNEVAPEAQCAIDRQALMAILRNLFRNAAEHAAPAAVTVSYQDRSLSVADDGPGIAEEELAFVFERYYRGRLADSPDPRLPGTPERHYERGLGLAIARQLAEANGWRIGVSRVSPRGTRFLISFGLDESLTGA